MTTVTVCDPSFVSPELVSPGLAWACRSGRVVASAAWPMVPPAA
jgi:hypothetical protein